MVDVPDTHTHGAEIVINRVEGPDAAVNAIVVPNRHE